MHQCPRANVVTKLASSRVSLCCCVMTRLVYFRTRAKGEIDVRHRSTGIHFTDSLKADVGEPALKSLNPIPSPGSQLRARPQPQPRPLPHNLQISLTTNSRLVRLRTLATDPQLFRSDSLDGTNTHRRSYNTPLLFTADRPFPIIASSPRTTTDERAPALHNLFSLRLGAVLFGLSVACSTLRRLLF